jgi:hypothetical protein
MGNNRVEKASGPNKFQKGGGEPIGCVINSIHLNIRDLLASAAPEWGLEK